MAAEVKGTNPMELAVEWENALISKALIFQMEKLE